MNSSVKRVSGGASVVECGGDRSGIHAERVEGGNDGDLVIDIDDVVVDELRTERAGREIHLDPVCCGVDGGDPILRRRCVETARPADSPPDVVVTPVVPAQFVAAVRADRCVNGRARRLRAITGQSVDSEVAARILRRDR